MPFNPPGLSALSTAGTFTLWYYGTADDRATVLSAGYFAPAALQLRAGDVIILQASDATALIPVRTGTAAGPGVTLDSSGSALNLLRSATLPFEVTQAASVIARAIAIGTLPTGLLPGTAFAATATVTGPISQLAFSLRDAGGTAIGAAQTIPVVAGSASANFTAPDPGGGYRVRVSDAGDPALVSTSPPFAVGTPPVLLTEAGGRLLLQSGGAIQL